jgi:hypothetical protein
VLTPAYPRKCLISQAENLACARVWIVHSISGPKAQKACLAGELGPKRPFVAQTITRPAAGFERPTKTRALARRLR